MKAKTYHGLIRVTHVQHGQDYYAVVWEEAGTHTMKSTGRGADGMAAALQWFEARAGTCVQIEPTAGGFAVYTEESNVA